MRIFVNERSLAQQYASTQAVAKALEAFLSARARHPLLGRAVYCTRVLPHLEIGDGQTLAAAIQALPPPFRTAFFNWVGRLGPFIDDDRQAIDEDLFLFDGEDVTDEGLGESARRLLHAEAVGVFSFVLDEARRFAVTPLRVLHGFADAPKAELDVTNFWEPAAAAAAIAQAGPEPSTWAELLILCRERFGSLTIGQHCEEVLSRYPFEQNVARRTIELLGVLQRMVDETDERGALSEAGRALKEQHFIGEKAWFTDESDRNKRDFTSEMTFPNPDGSGVALTCFWHGKIKTPQYRIHFEWPIPAPYDRLRVAYIGPKIAKR